MLYKHYQLLQLLNVALLSGIFIEFCVACVNRKAPSPLLNVKSPVTSTLSEKVVAFAIYSFTTIIISNVIYALLASSIINALL